MFLPFRKPLLVLWLLSMVHFSIAQVIRPLWSSDLFSIFPDSVVQHPFTAKALSPAELTSNYLSTYRHSDADHTARHWKLSKDISAFPQYRSGYPLMNAVYNLSLEEMINAVEPDSTFRTGKLWGGVWTRDISYSIILSMAYLQPKVAMNSLLKKVNGQGKIIQDTGTGGAYPCSTDRMIWAVAAWRVYEVTGDTDWLKKVYTIIKNSVEDDEQNIYDPVTGLVHGESSFLDWREETYPKWMQPADIYESECLGTNAVHYEANKVLSRMAKIEADPVASAKYAAVADRIKKSINQYLWMRDKGYYAQYLYGRNTKIISPRSEALGEALCILFNIADPAQQKSIIANTPVTGYGISCIYPQIPAIPPYHNNAVWPFVEAFWAMASAKAANETSVLTAISSVERAAALFVTNKENFVAGDGDYGGTQINSSNMLWSLSGNIGIIHKIIFGIRFYPDSLGFRPFVPKALQGNRDLTHFPYRNSLLDIKMKGYGNTIKTFSLDGRILSRPMIPATLKGEHSIEILLADEDPLPQKINQSANYFSPDTPVLRDSSGSLVWQPVNGAVEYRVLRNGKMIRRTALSGIRITGKAFAEYQVIAVDKKGIGSFASEPYAWIPAGQVRYFEAERFAPLTRSGATGFSGTGYVEISRSVNRNIQIPVQIENSGWYFLDLRYANGNGPVNTENKCAIRTLETDGTKRGTFVLPQRGVNDWNAWGYSNAVKVYLSQGKHILSIKFEPSDENMNGEINQAMVDYLRMIRSEE